MSEEENLKAKKELEELKQKNTMVFILVFVGLTIGGWMWASWETDRQMDKAYDRSDKMMKNLMKDMPK